MQSYEIKLYRGKLAMVWRGANGTQRISLGTTDRQEAIRLAHEQAQGIQRRTAHAYTVQHVWDIYRETLKGKPAYATMGYEAKALMPTFGAMLPVNITEDVVKAYIAGRRAAGLRPGSKGVRDGTIRTELTRLGCAMNLAVKRGWLAAVPELCRPAPADPRDRYLTKDEARRFIDALAAPHAKLFVVLALSTAARKEALLTLTWDRVDLDRRRIRLIDPEQERRMKGRALVPINATAHAALLEAKQRAVSPYVVEFKGEPIGSLRTTFSKAAKASGVHGVTPHVFRHTAGVWMAENRVPMEEIAQYMGHADHKITERVYARFSPEFLREAAQSLDF